MVRGSGRASPTGAVHLRNEPGHPSAEWCGLVRAVVRPAGTRYPGSPIDAAWSTGEHSFMELIQPSRLANRPSIAPLIPGIVVGTISIVAGVVLAYIALATPALRAALPEGRPTAGGMATGALIWAVALIAPAVFVLIGAGRLVRILGAVRNRIPRRSTTVRALDAMSDDVGVATTVTLPDGRTVSELVIGPFGAAVIRELPPVAVTRIREGRWELRTARSWIPLENPLERASRDAERVRRWLGGDDADFVVKVYAAVVGVDPRIQRTTDCAMLTPEQVVGWIGALPPQRTLTESRRQRIADVVRAAAG